MKLLLKVLLTCCLLCPAESLMCQVCASEDCSNTSSVSCPIFSACKTVTSVSNSSTSTSVTVNKNCSSLLTCLPALNSEVLMSVNYGFTKVTHVQLCCITDNCNSRTLDIPTSLANGNQCPACVSVAKAQSGSCNSTVSCEGVEDSCFGATLVTSNSTQFKRLGCVSRNLCTILSSIPSPLGKNATLACGADGNFRMSAMLLIFAVAVCKELL